MSNVIKIIVVFIKTRLNLFYFVKSIGSDISLLFLCAMTDLLEFLVSIEGLFDAVLTKYLKA